MLHVNSFYISFTDLRKLELTVRITCLLSDHSLNMGGGGAGGFHQIFRDKTSGPPFKLCEKFSGPPFRPHEKIGSPPFFQYFTSCHLTINNYKLTLNNEHRGLICNWWLSHHCLADFVYHNLLCTRPATG